MRASYLMSSCVDSRPCSSLIAAVSVDVGVVGKGAGVGVEVAGADASF